MDKLPKRATLKYDTPQDKITHRDPSQRRACEHHAGAHCRLSCGQGLARHGLPLLCAARWGDQSDEPAETVSYQVYNNNAYSVGISIAGNFVNGAIPTQRQIEQVGHLVAWLMQELNIPLNNVMGHKGIRRTPHPAPAATGTPARTGSRCSRRIAQVQARLIIRFSGKTIGHYMLFWQSAAGWAREDWGAATNSLAASGPRRLLAGGRQPPNM